MSATTIRPADFSRRGERNWILTSWIACDRATPAARKIESYRSRKSEEIQELLSRALTGVLCSSANQDALIGFVTYEPGTLHYVYVRKPDQHVGFARELLAYTGLIKLSGVRCTHQQVSGRSLPDGWHYSPNPHKEKTPCASAT
jgi:hypothetical protein